MTEDEMVGWYHRLDGCEFGQTPGVGDRQGLPSNIDEFLKTETNFSLIEI